MSNHRCSIGKLFFRRSPSSLATEDLQSDACCETSLYHFYHKVEDNNTTNEHKIYSAPATSDTDDRKTDKHTDDMTGADIEITPSFWDPEERKYPVSEHKYEKVNHDINSTLTQSVLPVDSDRIGRKETMIVKTASRKRISDPDEDKLCDDAETRNLSYRQNSEVENLQKYRTAGYDVPPDFLGYEKMERLDDPYVNREAEDMKISESTCLHPSSYVNIEDSGMGTQKLKKAFKTAKSSQPPLQFNKAGSVMAAEKLKDDKESTIKRRNQKGNQGGKILKSESDCVDGFKEESMTTRGDRVITKGNSGVIIEDNTLIREDGYNIPRPEGHYEEIKDDTN